MSKYKLIVDERNGVVYTTTVDTSKLPKKYYLIMDDRSKVIVGWCYTTHPEAWPIARTLLPGTDLLSVLHYHNDRQVSNEMRQQAKTKFPDLELALLTPS